MTLIAFWMIPMTELLAGMGSGPTCLNLSSLSCNATMLSTIEGNSRLKSRSADITVRHSTFLDSPSLVEFIIPPHRIYRPIIEYYDEGPMSRDIGYFLVADLGKRVGRKIRFP